MLMQKPARKLLDAQINYDMDREAYRTDLTKMFCVNTQVYRALVIPYAQFVSHALVQAIRELLSIGVPVYFLDKLPQGYYEGEGFQLNLLKGCQLIGLEQLTSILRRAGITELALKPDNNRIRYLHYKNEKDIYYFINEGTEVYRGTVNIPQPGPLYAYHAWDNALESVNCKTSGDGCAVQLELEPYESCILVLDEADAALLRKPLQDVVKFGREVSFADTWSRAICKSLAYPHFGEIKSVSLPDRLAEERPRFSGWARYTNRVELVETGRAVLTISDAHEGVEVFVNGVSAGVQVVPTYRFDISTLIRKGSNEIVIEVSTTLERERAAAKNKSITERMMLSKPLSPTGITGSVQLYVSEP